MKYIKRIFLVLFIFLLLALGLIVALPFMFQDRIVTTAKEEINKSLRAEVDFGDLDLSVFQSFPHLSVSLNDLSVVGVDRFEGVPLAQVGTATVTVDFWSLLANEGPLEIRSVELDEPQLNILVLADGAANYDIAIPEEEEVDSLPDSDTDLAVALQYYGITDGSVQYEDRSLPVKVQVQGLQHEGQGNFTLSEYDLATSTEITALDVTFDGIRYLKETALDLDAVLHINAETGTYTLKNNRLLLNALELVADGSIQLAEEDINLDMSFAAPSSDFKDLWSLIPNAYTADYDAVDIAGTFRLEGLVQGTYNEENYPAFRIQTKVEDGQVKYPDLPLPIRNIQADVDVNSPTADLDDMVIKVQPVSLAVGQDPFLARVQVQRPISDPDVNARVDGTIDLAQWAKAFPLEGVTTLAGKIIADVSVDTRLSTIEREAYEDVKMAGEVQVADLQYAAEGLPAVRIASADADFTPQAVKLNDFQAELGKSDIQASGSIRNVLAYISPEQTMRGDLRVRSKYFLADEWLEEEETAVPAAAVASPAAEEAVFDRFDFTVDAQVDRIDYDVYTIEESSLVGQVTPNHMVIDQASGRIGESDFRASGEIVNAFNYVFEDGVLGGQIDLASNYFDLNPFMEEPETSESADGSAEEAYGVIPIPANIDMEMDALVQRLQYTDMELRDLRGHLTIRDEAVVIEEGTARALGGQMDFAGAYDTQDISAPTYHFKLDLRSLDFGESFNTFNTFSSFAPIGKLVSGQFSSSLVMDGVLGEDMMPKLEDVDAEGLFETLNGSLAGLQPLNAIGNALDIRELKESVNLDNLKTWFSIKGGKFTVKPFDVELAELPMTIAGTHSLTQEMNYTINTVVPRSMLGSGALGNTVNAGLSSLVKQANSLGLPINDAGKSQCADFFNRRDDGPQSRL